MASYRYEREIRPEDLIQEQPRVLTPHERRVNWWHYHWRYLVLILCAVAAVGWYLGRILTRVEPDYVVTVVSRTSPEQAFLDEVEDKLETLAADENGDGRITVEARGIWLDLMSLKKGGDLAQLMESSLERLNAEFYLGESMIFLVDDPVGLEEQYGCFRRLDGTDPQPEESLAVEDYAREMETTALAGVNASADGRQWYLARRLAEGVQDSEALARGDALWAALCY